MPLVEKKLWPDEEIDAALVLTDPLLFALCFWSDKLTIPENRLDLPATWRGRQVISKEQRIIFLAGADYMVLRNVAPQIASRSARKVACRTSRKIAKTIAIEARMIQIPLLKDSPSSHQEEGMIHTPGDRQMAPLQDRYESKLEAVPLFRMMHKRFSRTDGIDNWRNGWTWHWRIEGSEARAGYAMIGLRASAMLGDEADYANEKAYIERKQTALPGCYEFWGGVPRGVRGIFWKECRNPRSGWKVLRYDMRANPLYHSEPAWAEQVEGDWQSQRTQTQILGKDGEVAVSSFPVLPVDQTIPFVVKEFNFDAYEANKEGLANFLRIPTAAVSDAEAWMIFLDYGFSPSPTELGVGYYRRGVWRTLARYEIRMVSPPSTAAIISTIDQQVLPKPAALILTDAHGQGFGVLTSLKEEPRYAGLNYAERAVDVGFPGSTTVPGVMAHKKCGARVRTHTDERAWICDRCGTDIYDMGDLRPATMQTKMYLTDELKMAFSEGAKVLQTGAWPGGMAIVLGNDIAAVDELSGTTEVTRPSGNTIYVPPMEGMCHITDHLRCLMSGALRFSQMLNTGPGAAVEEFGWMQGFGAGDRWRP